MDTVRQCQQLFVVKLLSLIVIHRAAKFYSLFDINSINVLCYWLINLSFDNRLLVRLCFL